GAGLEESTPGEFHLIFLHKDDLGFSPAFLFVGSEPPRSRLPGTLAISASKIHSLNVKPVKKENWMLYDGIAFPYSTCGLLVGDKK
ncbi:MAG TPA: hypothetical protein PLX83_06240, partial [bacterium]|nr:hypothetical protein [bacterium]